VEVVQSTDLMLFFLTIVIFNEIFLNLLRINGTLISLFQLLRKYIYSPFQEKKHENTSEEDNLRKSRHDNKRSSKTTTLSNSMVLQMRDQLIRAKIYLGLGSSRSHPTFIRELRVRIRDIQRVLGDATRDSELPKKYMSLSPSPSFFLGICLRHPEEFN
jgi:hypothetical protein